MSILGQNAITKCVIYLNMGLTFFPFKQCSKNCIFGKEVHLLLTKDGQVRGDMIVLILATDMARHAEILDNFKQKLDNFDYSSEVEHDGNSWR